MPDSDLARHLERGSCPHLAVLLRSPDALPQVLASFYALGAKRGGWLAHRAVSGEAQRDRDRLVGAGLDVAELEAGDQLVVVEFDPDEPPEESTAPWERALEDALEHGFSALWYSRFAVGPAAEQYAGVRAFERAWEDAFHDRPVVTLCPYVVGQLDGGDAMDRLNQVSDLHEGVLVPSGAGGFQLYRRS